jgi:putative endonuclease
MYFIYILECINNSFYTGYTTDIKRRYQEHLKGTAKCKYTRSFPPKNIAACWQIKCELSDVLSIERFIKKLNRHEKVQLISGVTPFIKLLMDKGYNKTIVSSVQWTSET